MSYRPVLDRLREGLEVERPDLVRVVDLIPHVVRVMVDRHVADEMNRADDVVEFVAVEHVRDAVLPA